MPNKGKVASKNVVKDSPFSHFKEFDLYIYTYRELNKSNTGTYEFMLRYVMLPIKLLQVISKYSLFIIILLIYRESNWPRYLDHYPQIWSYKNPT